MVELQQTEMAAGGDSHKVVVIKTLHRVNATFQADLVKKGASFHVPELVCV